MNRTVTAVVYLFVILGLVASVAPGNARGHNGLAAFADGSQPPVPPKMALLDGSQPPVPPKTVAWMLDGSQPPVPPKMVNGQGWMMDGS